MKQTELRRKSWIRRGTKPPTRKVTLAAVNVGAAKKRQRERKASQSAYQRSECARLVEARSGGRCEFAHPRNGALDIGDAFQWEREPAKWVRCGRPATDHHHRRYRKQPRPQDMIHGCDACHQRYEQLHRGYRAANRKRGAAA